jgi:hypothetical protein
METTESSHFLRERGFLYFQKHPNFDTATTAKQSLSHEIQVLFQTQTVAVITKERG